MSLPDCQGCREYMELSRRQFLAASGGTALAFSMPAWLPRVVLAGDFCSSRDVIVSIFLNGAADCLTMCVPHVQDEYYDARPTLAIPRPDSGSPFAAIDLDGFFGFPPMFAPLLPAYSTGNLLVVHATGLIGTNRSHFDARRLMEVADPASPGLFSGWLGRHLATTSPLIPNAALRAIGMADGIQRTLQGGPKTLPIRDLAAFGLEGSSTTVTQRRIAMEGMYLGAAEALKAASETTQITMDLLNTIDFANYTPGGGAVYPAPDSSFGYALKSTAALIKADLGVEAVAIDIGGWDTHIEMGAIDGLLSLKLADLAAGLAAFHLDMASGNGRNVTVVVMSEFGRRLLENGSLGTDHGYGTAMLVMGNNIDGGRVLTQWPGLAPEQLFEGRDLEITIDYRDILAEIVQQRLGNPNLDLVFPNYTPTFRGVTTACQQVDLNCDGQENLNDVPGFIQAVTDSEAYRSGDPACNVMGADVNGDGVLDARDVQGFVGRLTQQQSAGAARPAPRPKSRRSR